MKRVVFRIQAALILGTAVLSASACSRGISVSSNTDQSSGSSERIRRTSGGSTQTLYILSISSPAQNAAVSGTFQINGTGPGFLNVEVYDASGNRLAQVTPSSTGAFSASVDSTRLANGSQTLTIDGWDSPAGQTFNHTDEKKLTVNVSNASSGGSTGGSTGGATGGSSTPMGGPSGYTNLVMNDSFGSSKTGANITSLSQFNPGTSYGQNSSGWDDHMCGWDCGKANLSMASDHLEIRPTGKSNSGFIVSHFEYLPSGSHRLYYELRAVTGRGQLDPGGHTRAWPAFWLYRGNDDDNGSHQNEIDFMETYADQWDSFGTPYVHHFAIATHRDNSSAQDDVIIETPGIDVTTTYNVWGFEVYVGSNGGMQTDAYLNGNFVGRTTKSFAWSQGAPALILGWNPSYTDYSPAIMKIDYVKAWIK